MNIANMGGAISFWLGFQDKIGRAFMMNEDAIKYPLADYLVNDGGLNLNSIQLEYAHPNFPTRLIDVVVQDVMNGQIANAFELKLAKRTTSSKQEKERIFYDLVRMHFANQISGGDCYFIITGKSAFFQRNFRDLDENGAMFYKKWFSFVDGTQTTFNVSTETNTTYKEIYDSFINEYSSGFHLQEQLHLPSQITTTCQFVTTSNIHFVPYMTGIWSVK